MSITLPNLDDRSWKDLVDEGRARYARDANGTSDLNIHDPGITFLELFAWLTESAIFRLDQIPERHINKFLKLAGYSPKLASAAQSIISFAAEHLASPLNVPIGSEFAALQESRQIVFRSLRDVELQQIKLTTVYFERASGDTRGLTSKLVRGQPLPVFDEQTQVGDAIYFGFELLPGEKVITLGFFIGSESSSFAERRRIEDEQRLQRLACQRVLPDIQCNDGPIVESLPPVQTHHSAVLIWEYWSSNNGGVWEQLEPVTANDQPGLGEVFDDTGALTLDGIVELNLPSTRVKTNLDGRSDYFYYIRCRLVEGCYDAPLRLKHIVPNSTYIEQSSLVNQSLAIATGASISGTPPSVDQATEIQQLEIIDGNKIVKFKFVPTTVGSTDPAFTFLGYQAPVGAVEGNLVMDWFLLGRGNGLPDQTFELPSIQVKAKSIQLYTYHVTEGWNRWSVQKDLDASTRTNRHVFLDTCSWRLTGGNGERGQVYPLDSYIFVTYKTTDGKQGNVAANTVSSLVTEGRNQWLMTQTELQHLSAVPVTNFLTSILGADTEDINEAIARVNVDFHAHERLVRLAHQFNSCTFDQIAKEKVKMLSAPPKAASLLDIEHLAMNTPGTQVGRVRAWDGKHHRFPCAKAPGVVTVTILPALNSVKPTPCNGLITAVKQYLNRLRLVTTRIDVVGPEYLTIRIHVSVTLQPHTKKSAAIDRIKSKLDQLLNPLTGGPDGLGWPFGRNVYRSEILNEIRCVPGVMNVTDITILSDHGKQSCGNVSVCPTWLVCSGKHRITIN